MTRKTPEAEPVVLIECVVMSCRTDAQAPMARLIRLGWRGIIPSTRPLMSAGPPRQAIGWCPSCAEQYGVK